MNLALVLGAVASEGQISRARLATKVGLNKTTVSNLVAELLDRGMLVETGDDENPGSVGRPAQTLTVSGEHFAAVAIDVDYNRLAMSVVDLAGNVRCRSEHEFDARRAGPRGTANAIVRLGRQGLDSLDSAGLQVVDVTVAVDGVIDVEGEVIVRAPDLGWNMVPLA
ncbi:MAG: MarR family transcriptional regulator, partial [Chloroflexi bacterium]|nr:MarR family transcriptional regulator [Chloroflexota bacterium]